MGNSKQPNIRCPYWDCGWCYASITVENNSVGGACVKPYECPHFKHLLDKMK